MGWFSCTLQWLMVKSEALAGLLPARLDSLAAGCIQPHHGERWPPASRDLPTNWWYLGLQGSLMPVCSFKCWHCWIKKSTRSLPNSPEWSPSLTAKHSSILKLTISRYKNLFMILFCGCKSHFLHRKIINFLLPSPSSLWSGPWFKASPCNVRKSWNQNSLVSCPGQSPIKD